MVGSIKDYTKNFKLIIPEFDIATWHDYIEENFRNIDALFQNLFGINGFSGMWKTNSQYTSGQVVFVGKDNGSIYEGRLVKIIQDTNTAGYTYFSEALTANPEAYELYADASSAELFSQLAKDWANKTNGTVLTPEGIDTGEYSSKHYQLLCNDHEQNCLSYKNSAQTSASNAANSATSAANSATSAQNSATSAKQSQTSAATSAQTATNQASIATSKAQEAAQSATSAANSLNTLTTTATNAFNQNATDKTNAFNESVQASGVMTFRNATNCITSIPQDINLELTDGTLTLKSGSKVYTGTGKAININSNIVFHSGTIGSSTDSFFIFCNTSGGFGARVTSSQCISNSSNPGSGYYVWFDTTNNKVMYSANANGTFDTELSLPIGIYQRTNGNATSIKQVFNGFGYVANTVFALPDVEGLIPNGRNSDGTLNNYTYKVNNVIIRTSGTTYTGRYTVVGNAGDVFLLSSGYTYNYELNINENNGVKSNSCIIGTLDVSAGKITTFNIKKTFKAIDEFDYTNAVNDLSNYKASVNADNFTSTGKQTVVGWGMPDYTSTVSISMAQYNSSSAYWVAPYDCQCVFSSRDYANNDKDYAVCIMDGGTQWVSFYGGKQGGSGWAGVSPMTFNVKLGTCIYIESLNATITNNYSPFIY